MRRSIRDRVMAVALAAEAAVRLVSAMLALRMLPFRVAARPISSRPRQVCGSGCDEAQWCLLVATAIRRAEAASPLRFRCLARCLAARRMLARRGLRATIHLSAGSLGRPGAAAHAWLTVGNAVVLGGGAPFGQVEVGRLAAP